MDTDTEYTPHFEDFEPSGKELQIFTFPAPILKKKAAEVTDFDDSLKETCLDMLTTMYMAPGIGLAAPQVGLSKRIFVIDTLFEREKYINNNGKEESRLKNFKPLIFINPTIKEKSGTKIEQEGCLSFPGVFVDVPRAEQITVEYQNLAGEKNELTATGLLAICIQHEFDHIEGIVFLDRLSPLKKSMLTKKILKQKKKKK